MLKHTNHPDCWCRRCVNRDLKAADEHLAAWIKEVDRKRANTTTIQKEPG